MKFDIFACYDGAKNALKWPIFHSKTCVFVAPPSKFETYLEHSQAVMKNGKSFESLGWGTDRAILFHSQRVCEMQCVSKCAVSVYILSNLVTEEISCSLMPENGEIVVSLQPERQKMKYKAIIFDLDGTLTDTLEDLYLSVNHALRSCNLPERSLDEVRRFVGNGIRKLIERSVPEDTSIDMLERCFEAFRAYYVIHCQDHTRLYPGIASLLTALHAKGYRMAVVSNKLQAGVDELADTFFNGVIDVAIGEQSGIPRKPEPDMVRHALDRLGVKKEEAIYVGDSDVDLQTALNAGLPCISVLWGFRNRDFLVAHGATVLVESPQEVLELV